MTFRIAATSEVDGKYSAADETGRMHNLTATALSGRNFDGAVVRLRGKHHANEVSEDSCLFASGFGPVFDGDTDGRQFLDTVFANAHNATRGIALDNPTKNTEKGGAVMAAALRTRTGITCRVAGDACVFIVGRNGKVQILTIDQAIPIISQGETFDTKSDGPYNGIGAAYDDTRGKISDWTQSYNFGQLEKTYEITFPATIIVASDGITDDMASGYEPLRALYAEFIAIIARHYKGNIGLLERENIRQAYIKEIPESSPDRQEAERLNEQIQDFFARFTAPAANEWPMIKNQAQTGHVQALVNRVMQNGIRPDDPEFAEALAKESYKSSNDDISIVTMPLSIDLSDTEPALAVVCDGMGQHYRGDLVSQAAIASVVDTVKQRAPDLAPSMLTFTESDPEPSKSEPAASKPYKPMEPITLGDGGIMSGHFRNLRINVAYKIGEIYIRIHKTNAKDGAAFEFVVYEQKPGNDIFDFSVQRFTTDEAFAAGLVNIIRIHGGKITEATKEEAIAALRSGNSTPEHLYNNPAGQLLIPSEIATLLEQAAGGKTAGQGTTPDKGKILNKQNALMAAGAIGAVAGGALVARPSNKTQESGQENQSEGMFDKIKSHPVATLLTAASAVAITVGAVIAFKKR